MTSPVSGAAIRREARSGVVIRREAADESAAVHAVVADAFGDEQVADLVDALRGSSDWIDGLSFVAVESDCPAEPAAGDGTGNGRIVGHLLFTRSRLDTPTRLIDVLQLSPLSVATDRQRRGIGSALVRHGLAAVAAPAGEARTSEPPTPNPGDGGARTSACPLVFLEGSPAYYSRFGFVAAGPLGFRRPSLRIPPAAFQVCPLPGHRPWMTGTLIYPEIFWQYDSVGLRDEQGTTWPD